jgi:CubicO group peptidase (beta-lactamase class C family)
MLSLFDSRAQTSPTVPMTGAFLPGLERFDATVTGLMTKFNSPGAQLAILRNGRLVLARGYGYADRDANEPVQPDALFRVASLSKFVTAVATLTLVEQGRLDLEMKVFPFLGLAPLPNAANSDPRLQTITVRQLLHHTGGWDRDISADYTYSTTTIATAAGVPAPADVDTVIRYYLGLRLEFDPGTRYAYSNFGFLVLGRIIEKITGQPYASYVQTAVLGKAGITRAVSGRSFLENRQPNEVRYYDYPGAPLVRSAFPPTTALVPNPYGGFALENRYAVGAWLFTAIDYVRLLGAIDGSRSGAGILTPASIDLLTERPAPPVPIPGVNFYAMGLNLNVANGPGLRANWFHGGSLPGTSTYMVRFAGGTTYAIFFNSRPNGDDDTGSSDISAAMNATINSTVFPTVGDLFLSARPEFITAPVSLTASPGTTARFAATVRSLSTPTYQWFKDGVAMAGATAATLTLSNIAAGSAGSYHLVTTNAAGSTTSAAATLTVPALQTAGRLINLSILTALASNSDNFTMGYVAGGAGTSGAKSLLVRAAGPSLGALGVPGTVEDPRFELYLGSTLTGQNDNWGGAPALSAAMAGVGAFAYMAPTSRDAAALTTINAGENNSVKVSGSGGGQVIAELYDATPNDSFLFSTPRLLNVSVLKHLGTGLTVGFSIGGTTPVKVLVRAVGPTLGAAPFNVAGVVADPQLVLFNGSNRIGENNDWGGGTMLATAFAQVGAFALPTNSRDAAMLVTLAPGNYSAQVSGINNTTGVAIVEVYEVPDQP